MKIVEKQFKLKGKYWCWREVVLCNQVFSQIFDLPNGIKSVWLSLHNRPSANRLSCKVINCKLFEGAENFPVLKVEYGKGCQFEYDQASFDKILKPFIGKTVYLQCEYEQ